MQPPPVPTPWNHPHLHPPPAQRCGHCHGTLALLGAFNRDGTPAKPREPSAFAKFVSRHFAALKAATPHASHKELMAELGRRWRAQGPDERARSLGEGGAAPTGGPRCEEVAGEPGALGELCAGVRALEV